MRCVELAGEIYKEEVGLTAVWKVWRVGASTGECIPQGWGSQIKGPITPDTVLGPVDLKDIAVCVYVYV